ncbi:peptide/opine/nickel uptake family ABC transporter, permease/ATP-binding protein [Pseudonocardia sp. Ae168_Ps1]|uniref:ABC transporter ATP-binding protein n=1 Tax=unclassified Pseudonocardia TaxID=2619320 RepID=UPI00094B61F8|nr:MULTISPECIES: ABC transporter ATP-binding protein [unclassified Pseudonocardia]OLL76234.1 peptide/opine/nickel uptake family ABC transporter, permease/ATP-binding protein [Pseudonocardia sp. Ae150A_Ps1]OLL82233.1 peptide/opine/nickel uptake family ABC transporter, permease/ATP-binding protein [Pseudonocardia sp. Ae168_Ps1]OLL83651.1 peptide/opine/nickel uptake family ABC transporter, permease/ATP-binding protein [Pseudonocardia sp. Ae263_Ps1]OLL90308.1 peptide/opine/nickel uptake family ABC 
MTGSPTRPPSSDPVLVVRDLHIDYEAAAPVHAVRGVDLDVYPGELLGIAGESGCGKSTFAYAVARLLRAPARRVGGSIRFHAPSASPGTAGVELTELAGAQLRRFRWDRISMVFQGAMNALNPVQRISVQLDDVLRTHRPGIDRTARHARCAELLDLVGLEQRVLRTYPHELSGGMRQRVIIAMALALEPDVVLMDEPTTALDVLVQREILDAIKELQARLHFAVVFITHDLSLLLEYGDRIAVMYAGRIVEIGTTTQIKNDPKLPYTAGLLEAFPTLRSERRERRGIPGHPPDLALELTGCAFADRCGFVMPECTSGDVHLVPTAAADVACKLHHPHTVPDGSPASLDVSAVPRSAGRDHR